jgi:hypothetical protein
VGVFEILDSQGVDLLAVARRRPQSPPLGRESWAALFDGAGRMIDAAAFKKLVFYGCDQPSRTKAID